MNSSFVFPEAVVFGELRAAGAKRAVAKAADGPSGIVVVTLGRLSVMTPRRCPDVGIGSMECSGIATGGVGIEIGCDSGRVEALAR